MELGSISLAEAPGSSWPHLNVGLVLEQQDGAGEVEVMDALRRRHGIRAWGSRLKAGGGGLALGKVSRILSLPEGREYSQLEMTVTLGGGIESALLDALASFRCTTPHCLAAQGEALLAVLDHLAGASGGVLVREQLLG